MTSESNGNWRALVDECLIIVTKSDVLKRKKISGPGEEEPVVYLVFGYAMLEGEGEPTHDQID